MYTYIYLTDKSQSTKQDPRKTRHVPDNEGGAEVMPRDSDSDTSGALPGCLHCMSLLCVRALHLPARTLPFFCAFVSVFALADTPCLRARVLCLRDPSVLACPAPAVACFPCPCACVVSCFWSTCSIAVSFPTPWIVIVHHGRACTSIQSSNWTYS